MPAYRFSLSVRVGCEVNFIGFFDLFFKPFDYGFFIRRNNVIGFVIFRDVDAEPFFGQIPHMPAARVYLILSSEILLDRFRLRGRFHYNKLHNSSALFIRI